MMKFSAVMLFGGDNKLLVPAVLHVMPPMIQINFFPPPDPEGKKVVQFFCLFGFSNICPSSFCTLSQPFITTMMIIAYTEIMVISLNDPVMHCNIKLALIFMVVSC